MQAERSDEQEPDALVAVLSGRPVLTLTFSDLDMRVKQPQAYEPAEGRASSKRQPAFA